MSRREADGKPETVADDQRFWSFLAARTANAAHKSRDLNREVGNSLFPGFMLLDCEEPLAVTEVITREGLSHPTIYLLAAILSRDVVRPLRR